MNKVIFRYHDGTTLTLTTDSPASSYGLPVLRYDGCECPDMGPSDPLCKHAHPPEVRELFGEETAGAFVARRSERAPEAARRFCAQWPDGPQP